MIIVLLKEIRVREKGYNKRYPQIRQFLSSILAALIVVFGLILFLATLFRQ